MYSRHMVAVLSDSDINYLKDLEGCSVAVMSSTRPESVFLQREGDNIPNIKNLYCMRNMDLVFSSLSLEYVDAIAGHETVLRQGMQKNEDKYRLLDEDLLSAKVGIAFQKGQNEDVLEKLNNTLLNMINDGTLKQTLEKYEISADGVGGGEEQ